MLQSSSLIVNLNISQWTARKHDRKITDEVATTHNASADAGRYNKMLVAPQNLTPIQQAATRARDFHYDNTLPWGDNGDRLLSSKNYFIYIQKMQELQSEFETAVAAFLRNYDVVIAEAKIRLNGMFKDSDYPRRTEIESKYGFKTTFMPVPDNDIRVTLNDKEIEKLRNSVEVEITNRLTAAVGNIWERIREQVTHMRDKLADHNAIFRDSLFGNLSELVDLLPRLNVTNDADIARACEDMRKLISDPDAIRQNVQLRSAKADDAAQILNKFKSFF